MFLTLVQNIDQSLLKRFCGAIDRLSAAERWSNLLRDRAEVRRGTRKVLRIISQNCDCETKELAESLLAVSIAGAKPTGSGQIRTRRGKL